MRCFLLLILTIFLFSTDSHAQTVSNGKGLVDYTLKKNGMIVNTWPAGIDSVYGPKQCSPQVLKLSELMDDYSTSGYLNASGQNKSVRKKISHFLKTLPQDDCFQWIHAFYAVRSISTLSHYTTTESNALFNIAAMLFDQRRLVPLTDSLRQEWGGVWKDQPGLILGAYQCEQTIIYFDPDLPPYNLAAVLTHELDHLVRDKFTYWKPESDQFIQSARSTLLLDEALSTMHASFAQLAMKQDLSRDSDASVGSPMKIIEIDNNGMVDFFKRKSGRHFRLEGDFDLYDRKGNLKAIFDHAIKNGGLARGLEFSEFLSVALFPQLKKSSVEVGASMRAILTMISKAYFDGNADATEPALAELIRWNSLNSDLVSPLGALQLKSAHRIDEKTSYMDQTFFNTLNARMLEVSEGCRVLAKSIREDQSLHYIGSKLSGGQGTRPNGGEGVRTTNGEGVRTTNGEGVRTDIPVKPAMPLSPCLRMDGGV